MAPEFRGATPARVQGAIAQATLRTDSSIFGTDPVTVGTVTITKTDAAIFYLAAHLLVSSPTGTEARLKGEGFVSVYLEERHRLEAELGPLLGTSLGVGFCGW